MTGWLAGWRLALKLARRDLLKHRARAVIALMMVTLPVFAVVVADVLIQTAQVSSVEGLDRTLGTVATARLDAGRAAIMQTADPAQNWGTERNLKEVATRSDIEAILGDRTMEPAPRQFETRVITRHGTEAVGAQTITPRSPMFRGFSRLESGRWPQRRDEVVVNRALRARGVGDEVTVLAPDRTESRRHVVGTVRDASTRTGEVIAGLPGSLPGAGRTDEWVSSWLIDGPALTWDQAQRLNAIGVLVTDRHLVTHADEYDDPYGISSGYGSEVAEIVVLVVTMALIEVVLLAGPAIAVGARKQQRSLALIVAAGGEPRQARRVILAGGIVLGLLAGVVGVPLGIAAGWALQPVAQRFNDQWLGPFDVPWPHLLAVALFGLVSAVLACLVPAWISSRQDVVAVLNGRRGDAKPVRAFPVIGLVVFGIGVLVAIGATVGGGSEIQVSWAAVICVIGMVMLVPVVVGWVARLAGRFPLPVRFAARDAVRHRTRTTPAVAAVAATVAGVVALGISLNSDEKQNRETYTFQVPMGTAVVTPSYDYYGDAMPAPDWSAVGAVIDKSLPEAEQETVQGVPLDPESGESKVAFRAAGSRERIWPPSYGEIYGSDLLVSDGSNTVVESVRDTAEIRAALRAGRVVLFSSDPGLRGLDTAVMRIGKNSYASRSPQARTLRVPATVVQVGQGETLRARAVLPPEVARRAGLTVKTVGIVFGAPEDITRSEEKDLQAALQALNGPASVYVERGYQTPAEVAIIQWVLAALGAILMLGGTLTAVFLALADARPDLATLAAVGAAPRTRRGVAAAYTFVIAFVGAVLGMVVGFVPGIAVTWPLTAEGYPGGPYLDIPWLLIAVVVVGLPVMTAALVGLVTRSRLPMVERMR